MSCCYLKKGIISSSLLSCLLLVVYPDLYVYVMCFVFNIVSDNQSNCVVLCCNYQQHNSTLL